MKAKTKENLKKFGIVLSVIGALGSVVYIGDTLFGHKGGGGSGNIVNPAPGPDSGGSGDHVNPETPTIKELKEINPTFCLGGIEDTSGKYVKNDTQLFNRFAFGTKDLSIELTPESDVNYQVFYYDGNETLVGKSPLLDVSTKTFDIPKTAVNGRVEITPKNGAKISWEKIPYYANQLNFKAEKTQIADLNTKGIIEGSYGYDHVKGTPLMYVYNGVYKSTNFDLTVRNGLYTVDVKKKTGIDEEVKIRTFEESFNYPEWAIMMYDSNMKKQFNLTMDMDYSSEVQAFESMMHNFQCWNGTYSNARVRFSLFDKLGKHSYYVQGLYGDYRGLEE